MAPGRAVSIAGVADHRDLIITACHHLAASVVWVWDNRTVCACPRAPTLKGVEGVRVRTDALAGCQAVQLPHLVLIEGEVEDVDVLAYARPNLLLLCGYVDQARWRSGGPGCSSRV